MSTVVLTLAIGTAYQALATVTHPSLRAYAARIGADFHCITTPRVPVTSPHWAKFELADFLDVYDRVLYLDTDVIIRDDCPNVFPLVPEDCLGAFNEAPFAARSRELLIDVCKAYGVTLAGWDGRYFNTGVLVVSRAHQALFRKPDHEECNFYEQTYVNMLLALHGVPMQELPYHYNRMSCLDASTGEHRLCSYIVHYAGAPNIQTLLPLVRDDLERWATLPSDDPLYQRHIHVIVSGGLGDQVNAEPALRYLSQHVYPEAHITVSTHWPRLFRHLDVTSVPHGAFRPEPDRPYYTVQSLPPPESVTWSVLSNLLCHTVDYCSAALLRRLLPMEDKRVHLQVDPDDARQLAVLLPGWTLSSLIVVHCGRHWNTKTFPCAWWQAVVDGIAEAGRTVCLIGQDDETRGVVPVVCPPGGLDVRQQLTLGQLIALLSQASVLVSNDSAPIHLAGAFEHRIILIPSCKHPEHVLPYRHGSVFWRAISLYRQLTLDEVSTQPTQVHGSTAEFEVHDWNRYLPDVADVIQASIATKGVYGHE